MVAALLVLSTTVFPAQGAIQPASWGGAPLTDPTGLADVTVRARTIRVDLKPIGDGQSPAKIALQYHITHTGADRRVGIGIVVAESQAHSLEVRLDDTPLVTGRQQRLGVTSQAAPPATPALNDASVLYQPKGGGTPIFFQAELVLTPGEHVLAITYGAAVCHRSDSNPKLWQLVYVFAERPTDRPNTPTEVTVELPAGWQANGGPDFFQSGDTLAVRYPGAPSQPVAISARHPGDPDAGPTLGFVWLISTGVIGFLGCIALGIHRGRRGQGGFAWGLLGGLSWAILLAGGAVAAVATGGDGGVPDSQRNQNGFGLLWIAFQLVVLGIVAVAAIPFGSIITGLSALLVKRRFETARRIADAPR